MSTTGIVRGITTGILRGIFPSSGGVPENAYTDSLGAVYTDSVGATYTDAT